MDRAPRTQAARSPAIARAVAPTPMKRGPSDGDVMSKAVVRAAGLLGLTQREVADVLGVSIATASRLFAGSYRVSPQRPKEWELARLFVRLFRSLDTLWGHGDAAREWLTSHNVALCARPADLIGSVEGLVRVVAYLDNARGRL